MIEESRQCQSCKIQFAIEPEDFEFYKKIDVPPPTWCPRCRLERRLSFYNLTNLFKRPCDLCKRDAVSMYPPEAPYLVYCPECWSSDKWNHSDYARDFDPSRPFLEQVRELWKATPHRGLSIDPSVRTGSPYTNQALAKNSYLIFQANHCEDCLYGFYLMFDKNTLDSSLIYSSERVYDCSNCYRDNNCIGLRGQVTESIDCAFLSYSHNCQNCFASRNLRNKKYVAFNQQYTKEEYQKIVSQYDLGSWKTYQEVQKMAEEHWKKYPPDPDVSERSVASTGSTFYNCKNCKECYEVVGAENCKYMLLIGGGPVSDSYDISSWGENIDQCYDSIHVGIGAANVRFSFDVGTNSQNVEYSAAVFSSSNLLGCVNVRNGSYCILNKQYSKEEYEDLHAKIIKQMKEVPFVDSQGRRYFYGELFPPEFSCFGYNLTLANLFFPKAKEEASEKGYAWRDMQSQEYVHTINTGDLPDHIKDTPDSITKEVIGCSICGRGFRILENELAQRRQMNVPLPRNCPFCRVNEKMQGWVKSLTLHGRVCAQCGVSFKTNFDEAEAPYILCKACYMKEVI